MQDITWLIIADSSRARLYALHKAKFFEHPDDGLKLLRHFDHEDSRKKSITLTDEKAGKRHYLENNTPHLHEAELFAHELAAALQAGLEAASFRDVVLVAPPHFMGLLKKILSHHLQIHISQTIEKDYTQLAEPILAKQLLQHF